MGEYEKRDRVNTWNCLPVYKKKKIGETASRVSAAQSSPGGTSSSAKTAVISLVTRE